MTRHYFHVSENALQNAVGALPDVGGTLALPDGAQATGNASMGAADVQAATAQAEGAEGRFSAFCAAFDALVTEEERERARAYIERRKT